jgi:hypothetical protein
MKYIADMTLFTCLYIPLLPVAFWRWPGTVWWDIVWLDGGRAVFVLRTARLRTFAAVIPLTRLQLDHRFISAWTRGFLVLQTALTPHRYILFAVDRTKATSGSCSEAGMPMTYSAREPFFS